jgi:hypothetical protein
MLLSPAAYQQIDFPLNSPLLTPRVAPTPLYARLFDRFGPASDPNSPYQPQDADKKRMFRQGLLAFAAASAKANGGNLADSLASGLLAANGAMQDGSQQYANDAYRADIMKRTQAEMAANTAKQTAYSHLYGDDGQLNPAGVREVQQVDPQGYLNLHDKLYPQETAWQPKDVNFNGAQGTVLWNAKTGEMRTLDGQPFAASNVASAPQTGAAGSLLGGALDKAVESVESGGNPLAVSSAGAVGPMQTLPGTLRDPGFGVAPAKDGSVAEQRRVGQDYLHALTGKYGVQGGLAAYNWGPGNWEAALGRYGSPDAALAHAPAETRAYVPKVLSQTGGQSSGLPFGFAPKKPEKLSTVDQRKQDLADMEANGIKVTPSMRNQYLMTGKMPGEDGGATPDNPTEGLDPATAALVKKIANYDALPASLGRAGNRADLIGRAAMLNPDYNEANAKEAYTFKQDMGRSSPQSAGGQVTAANTLMHHLGALMRDNKALNDAGVNSGSPMLNKLSGAMSHQRGVAAVNNWNQARQLVAEEVAKLVKGGVATEGEVNGLMAQLDAANSPEQRNAAILQLAELAHGRLSAIASHRDQVLGDMGASVQILSPESQRLYDAVQRLSGKAPASSAAPAAAGRVLRYNPATGRIE